MEEEAATREAAAGEAMVVAQTTDTVEAGHEEVG